MKTKKVIKQKKTTKEVQKIKTKRGMNDEELCILLGITKPTLYTRKEKHNWKLSEVAHIKLLSKEEV